MKIKNSLLIFASTLSVISCSVSLTKEPTSYFAYMDYSEVTTDSYRFKINNVNAYKSYSGDNYSFSLELSIKNLTNEKQTVVLSNYYLIRESKQTKYTASCTGSTGGVLELESEIEGIQRFSATIPSSLDENYYFSVDANDARYQVYLYETPDELRPDVTVQYKVNQKVVSTKTVKKGRQLGQNFVYETGDHQYYASTWKNESGSTITSTSFINEDIVVTGSLLSTLNVLTTQADVYSYINGINRVPSDGIIVVLDKYSNKDVCLGNYAIHHNINVKEVYLPKTLKNIYNGNFEECGNLKTIYYAGSEEEWNAIPKSFVTIPSSVSVVFNVSFEVIK